ncbi:MAG TPA: hypothetical protein VGE30_00465 [Candidatus Saccharimonadales bacterium]
MDWEDPLVLVTGRASNRPIPWGRRRLVRATSDQYEPMGKLPACPGVPARNDVETDSPAYALGPAVGDAPDTSRVRPTWVENVRSRLLLDDAQHGVATPRAPGKFTNVHDFWVLASFLDVVNRNGEVHAQGNVPSVSLKALPMYL